MSMWFRCSCTLYAVPYNALIVELIAYSIKTDSHAPRDRDAHRHKGGEIKSIPCVAVFKRNAHPKLQKKNEFKPNLFGACLFGRLAQFMHFNHNHRCCSGMWKLSKYLCIELSIQSRQQGKYIDDGKKNRIAKKNSWWGCNFSPMGFVHSTAIKSPDAIKMHGTQFQLWIPKKWIDDAFSALYAKFIRMRFPFQFFFAVCVFSIWFS